MLAGGLAAFVALVEVEACELVQASRVKVETWILAQLSPCRHRRSYEATLASVSRGEGLAMPSNTQVTITDVGASSIRTNSAHHVCGHMPNK